MLPMHRGTRASTSPRSSTRCCIEARGLLDQAKRKEIYDEMQVMISEEAGTIIPAYISNVDAISSKVKGLESNPLGGMMGYAMAEYVWLEA